MSEPKHRAEVRFLDRRKDNYRRSLKLHRAIGPEREPTIYDMPPDELTAAKGAGPRY